jgi:cytochrome c oxidase subunit IV
MTRALTCLNELFSLFILNGVKVVPAIIFDLLTPIALADSFSVQDCVRLLNVLIIKYDLDVTLYKHMGKSRLLIRSVSMDKLRSLVLNHMPESMHYKLVGAAYNIV